MPDPSTVPEPGDRSARSASEWDPLAFAEALIGSRQNVSPKRLVEPGPTMAQLDAMFQAAAAAPDHGQIRPWRFVVVPAEKRPLLGEVFALALADRDAAATPDQLRAAREKAARAPLLVLAVARLGPAEPDVPMLERLVSLGCAIQNMLLTVHASGLGAGLTSGQAMRSPRLREFFGLAADEEPVCFVNVGTVTARKSARPRPSPIDFVREL